MLVDTLKTTLADAFTFYLKAQYYHWNVEGPNFAQYHEFMGELYEDVHSSVDAIAELIRTLDSYAPGTLARFKELTSIEETDTIPSALAMLSNLEKENTKLRASLLIAYQEAEKEGEVGISNYLQDRIQAHEKHGWMLRSFLK
jgi:starvation-inducible DNA-binding protein